MPNPVLITINQNKMYRKQNKGIVTNFKSKGTYFFTRQHADACNSPKAPPSALFKFKRLLKGVMMFLPTPALVLIWPLGQVCSSNTHSSLQTPQGLHIRALQPLTIFLAWFSHLPISPSCKFQCNRQVPQPGSQIPKQMY